MTLRDINLILPIWFDSSSDPIAPMGKPDSRAEPAGAPAGAS